VDNPIAIKFYDIKFVVVIIGVDSLIKCGGDVSYIKSPNVNYGFNN